MPKEFHEVAKMYDRMSSWTSSEWGIIGRNLAKITTKMKQLLTLPRMGFHTRNMIGDIFMGLLDDVNPDDYYEVARKWGLTGLVEQPISTLFPAWKRTTKR